MSCSGKHHSIMRSLPKMIECFRELPLGSDIKQKYSCFHFTASQKGIQQSSNLGFQKHRCSSYSIPLLHKNTQSSKVIPYLSYFSFYDFSSFEVINRYQPSRTNGILEASLNDLFSHNHRFIVSLYYIQARDLHTDQDFGSVIGATPKIIHQERKSTIDTLELSPHFQVS